MSESLPTDPLVPAAAGPLDVDPDFDLDLGPEEREVPGRTAFFIIVWITTGLALGAHVRDAGVSAGPALAAVGIGAQALWLHGIHRIHRWTADNSGRRRLLVMLAGVYLCRRRRSQPSSPARQCEPLLPFQVSDRTSAVTKAIRHLKALIFRRGRGARFGNALPATGTVEPGGSGR